MGLIALVFIAAAALGLYFTARFVRGGGGYSIGVHFPQAAGVAPGGQVFLNGVDIGTVSKVIILPDTSVDFIINVFRDTGIPKDSKFTVQTAFTGGSKVMIVAPVGSHEMWPKRILPESEQPVGTPPLSLEAFMSQSRGLGDRADAVLGQARPYGPRLLSHVQNAKANSAGTMQEMRSTFPAVMGSLQSTIARAKANAQDAQSALRERDQPKIAAVAQAFSRSAIDMQQTAQELHSLKRDPQIRENVRAASAQLRIATQNLARLSHDMQMVTGNSQTKAQLRDAGARLRAILHKI